MQRIWLDVASHILFFKNIEMKHIKKFYFITIFVLFFVNQNLSQPLWHVDERFELTSIVFRLTDDISFVHSSPEVYIADVDTEFSKFKNHELITFIKKTIYSKSVLNIALPMFLASDIKITPSGIVWTDEWLKTFEEEDTQSDGIFWTREEMTEYLLLLNKFYKDSDFHNFYIKHTDFYASIESAFTKIYDQLDSNWFDTFFGIPYEMDNIWLVPANGNFNFSVNRIDSLGKEHHNCAISGIEIDKSGQPYFHPYIFKTLMHEICHNYNNPICKKYEYELKPVCDTLYSFVSKMLEEEYYGSPLSITTEGFNRLCEYSYYKSHKTFNDSILNDLISTEEFKGFIWFGEMLCYMNAFESNRNIYPHFEDFMPQLKLFLEQTVGLMKNYYLPKYNLFRPRVVATYPAFNSIVDTSLNKIMIQFSKPMQEIKSVNQVKDSTVSLIPVDWENIHWENEYIYVIPLKGTLKPNSKYGFHVSDFFADAIEFFATIPYDLIFETK